MKFIDTIKDKFKSLMGNKESGKKKSRKAPTEKKKAPAKEERKKQPVTFLYVVKLIWLYLYKFRGVIFSIPVAIGAVWLALRNLSVLPEMVGINLLADGTYSMMMPRMLAVLTPLVLTAFCILLTICSRRTLFPWLISVFTLVLPLLIWVTNIYPA